VGRTEDSVGCGERSEPHRQRLRRLLELPSEPLWLRQVHGIAVHDADADPTPALPPEADAAVASTADAVLVVLTADCLPVVFAADDASTLAVAHAGWRGLAGGVLEATIAAMRTPTDRIHAWLGPAIGQRAFEVGPEVRAAFVDADPGAAVAFVAGRDDRWHADLHALARRRLERAGLKHIAGGGWCTHEEAGRFHSFRRDGAASGRMATLVWRDAALR
jgi:YfiH family protein